MDDGAAAMTRYLNTGEGLSPPGWSGFELQRFHEFDGCTWVDDSGPPPITGTKLSFAQQCTDIGITSVLDLGFQKVGGKYWYAGITLLEGH
jgi:hypothetical protein